MNSDNNKYKETTLPSSQSSSLLSAIIPTITRTMTSVVLKIFLKTCEVGHGKDFE